jgi:polyisoprenoid-binding protein YceI
METHKSTGGASATARAGLERWEIDPTGSSLEFTLRHLIIQEIRGVFNRWGGTVFIDRQQPAQSRVEVWIELGSIDTGSTERDDHVRSAEFLDVERFPRARFTSTEITVDDEQIRVRGLLYLHGVNKEVEIEVTPGATSPDANGVARSQYLAHGAINRQVFGLHWNQDLDVGGVVVGDRIELRARVETLQVPGDGRGSRA